MTGRILKNNDYLWDLLVRAQSGDPLAFNDFFNEFYTPVYRYLLIRVKHKETAEDCTQITFTRVFQNIRTIEKTAESPLQYVFTVARNILIDEKRKKRPENIQDEVWGTIESPEKLEETVENQEIYAIILETISELNEEDCETLTMRLLEARSHDEIAEVLGKTTVSVRKIFSRALEKLREKLQKKGITYEN